MYVFYCCTYLQQSVSIRMQCGTADAATSTEQNRTKKTSSTRCLHTAGRRRLQLHALRGYGVCCCCYAHTHGTDVSLNCCARSRTPPFVRTRHQRLITVPLRWRHYREPTALPPKHCAVCRRTQGKRARCGRVRHDVAAGFRGERSRQKAVSIIPRYSYEKNSRADISNNFIGRSPQSGMDSPVKNK